MKNLKEYLISESIGNKSKLKEIIDRFYNEVETIQNSHDSSSDDIYCDKIDLMESTLRSIAIFVTDTQLSKKIKSILDERENVRNYDDDSYYAMIDIIDEIYNGIQ